MPSLAIGIAVSMIAAQNIGAQRWDRVGSIAHLGIVYSIVVTGSIVALMYVFDGYAYRLFLPDRSPAVAIASHINSVVAWSLVPFSISIVLFNVTRAASAVIVPLFWEAVAFIAVRFPLAAALMDRWQADAIWWSLPASTVLIVALAMLYYVYGG